MHNLLQVRFSNGDHYRKCLYNNHLQKNFIYFLTTDFGLRDTRNTVQKFLVIISFPKLIFSISLVPRSRHCKHFQHSLKTVLWYIKSQARANDYPLQLLPYHPCQFHKFLGRKLFRTKIPETMRHINFGREHRLERITQSLASLVESRLHNHKKFFLVNTLDCRTVTHKPHNTRLYLWRRIENMLVNSKKIFAPII